jgi:hypothetical protein
MYMIQEGGGLSVLLGSGNDRLYIPRQTV